MYINFDEMVRVTNKHLLNNSIEDIIVSTTEELGEMSAAHKVESGKKNKQLRENSKVECVDAILCLLSFFVAKGGTKEEFYRMYDEKMGKWEAGLNKQVV